MKGRQKWTGSLNIVRAMKNSASHIGPAVWATFQPFAQRNVSRSAMISLNVPHNTPQKILTTFSKYLRRSYQRMLIVRIMCNMEGRNIDTDNTFYIKSVNSLPCYTDQIFIKEV